MPAKTLDTSGLHCPLPLLKTKNTLNDITSGELLKLISTDAGSIKDISAFCRQTNNKLISINEVNNKYIFIIKKK